MMKGASILGMKATKMPTMADAPDLRRLVIPHKKKGRKLQRPLGTVVSFLNAFIDTMEKLGGGLNVPVKLWR